MTPELVLVDAEDGAESPAANDLAGRQDGGISRELKRIEQFDQHVRQTIASLWARIHLLEDSNDDLRAELGDRHRFEGKE
jgi:hypothetical protein